MPRSRRSVLAVAATAGSVTLAVGGWLAGVGSTCELNYRIPPDSSTNGVEVTRYRFEALGERAQTHLERTLEAENDTYRIDSPRWNAPSAFEFGDELSTYRIEKRDSTFLLQTYRDGDCGIW